MSSAFSALKPGITKWSASLQRFKAAEAPEVAAEAAPADQAGPPAAQQAQAAERHAVGARQAVPSLRRLPLGQGRVRPPRPVRRPRGKRHFRARRCLGAGFCQANRRYLRNRRCPACRGLASCRDRTCHQASAQFPAMCPVSPIFRGRVQDPAKAQRPGPASRIREALPAPSRVPIMPATMHRVPGPWARAEAREPIPA